MGLSQIGGASYTRLVTKQNTAGQAPLGSANASAVGTWYQIIASLSADSIITQVAFASSVSQLSAWNDITLEVGIGGSGSETVVTTTHMHALGAIGSNGIFAVSTLVLPQRIAAGQRVAARLTGAINFNSSLVGVYLLGAPYVNVEGN